RKRSPPGFFPAWARPTNGSPWRGPRRPPGNLRPPPRPRTREPVNFSDALNAPQTPPMGYHPVSRGDGPIGSTCNHSFYFDEAPGKGASRGRSAASSPKGPPASGGQRADPSEARDGALGREVDRRQHKQHADDGVEQDARAVRSPGHDVSPSSKRMYLLKGDIRRHPRAVCDPRHSFAHLAAG